jgi:hypothetical protein
MLKAREAWAVPIQAIRTAVTPEQEDNGQVLIAGLQSGCSAERKGAPEFLNNHHWDDDCKVVDVCCSLTTF